MSDTDSVTMAIADLYAEALLEAAREKEQERSVLADYEELVSYMEREPDFEAFLTSALVDDDPRRASLERLFRGRMNDLLLNMLQVLNNRRRCELVRPVLRCVQRSEPWSAGGWARRPSSARRSSRRSSAGW